MFSRHEAALRPVAMRPGSDCQLALARNRHDPAVRHVSDGLPVPAVRTGPRTVRIMLREAGADLALRTVSALVPSGT